MASFTVTLTKEEKEVVEQLLQDSLIQLGDTRVHYNTLASLIEVKSKLENAVKCYS